MINLIQYNSSNNVIPQPPTTQRGSVIPPPTTQRGKHAAFKSSEKSTKTSKRQRPKDSFLFRYRGTIGFLVGLFAGDFLAEKFICKLKSNPTSGMRIGIGLLFNLVFGLAGSKIAEEIGKK